MTNKQRAERLRDCAKSAHESAAQYEAAGHLRAADVALAHALRHEADAKACDAADGVD